MERNEAWHEIVSNKRNGDLISTKQSCRSLTMSAKRQGRNAASFVAPIIGRRTRRIDTTSSLTRSRVTSHVLLD